VSLRDALIAAGVAPADLDDAIRSSRRAVARASAGARFLSSALHQVGESAKPGSKRQIVALVGSSWLDRFAEETGRMVRPRGRR